VDPGASLEHVRRRFDRATVGRLLLSTLAAAVAWEVAVRVAGHPRPFFAPIAVLIALQSRPGTRGAQAIRLLVGVALGIVVGAIVVAVLGVGVGAIVMAVAICLVLGTAFAAQPITTVQAAASAILVVALHLPGQSAGGRRLVDALIGGGIAILVARFLFPIDPVQLVRRESERLRAELADALDQVAAALGTRDLDLAVSALTRIDAVDESRLLEAIAIARDVVRRAPRRRRLRPRIELSRDVAAALDAAVADARAIGTGALRLLRTEAPVPPGAAEAVSALAAAIRAADPEDVRAAVTRSREAAARAQAADGSLGTGVLVHAVLAVADDLDRVRVGREAGRRFDSTSRRLTPRRPSTH